MKKLSLLFGLILIICSSCNRQTATIIGEIEGLGNDTIFVEYMTFTNIIERNGQAQKDTIIVKDGKFAYNFKTDENVMMFLEPKKLIKTRKNGRKFQSDTRSISLMFGADDKLKVSGKVENDYLNYSISGTTFAESHSSHRFTNKAIKIKADSIEMLIDSYSSTPNSDSIIEKLFAERNGLFGELGANDLSYIKANLNADLAGFYLTNQPDDTFAVYYSKLGEDVKNGMFKSLIAQRQKAYEEAKLRAVNEAKIKPGALAPDFSLKNLAGNNVSLSSMKGKYIVLDFWGSWCGWCIKGYPRMKEYYEKYKDKVEFVGIACKDKDESWRKAINEHQLNWVQLFNSKTDDINKDVSILYAIKGYPSKILLDTELKIVEVFTGESDDFYNKLDEEVEKLSK